MRKLVHFVRFAASAAYYQRRARLVYQYAVHLVHYGEVQSAHYPVFLSHRHVVAQVVEAHLVIGGVGDVAVVGGALFFRLHARLVHAHGKPHEFVDIAHPARVALGEIFVDRDDVHALSRKCVEVHGQRGYERFSFARAHFGYSALVQDYSADKLHVKVAHMQDPVRRLPDRRKGVGQQIVQRFARGKARPESGRARRQLFVAHCLVFIGERLYFISRLP